MGENILRQSFLSLPPGGRGTLDLCYLGEKPASPRSFSPSSPSGRGWPWGRLRLPGVPSDCACLSGSLIRRLFNATVSRRNPGNAALIISSPAGKLPPQKGRSAPSPSPKIKSFSSGTPASCAVLFGSTAVPPCTGLKAASGVGIEVKSREGNGRVFGGQGAMGSPQCGQRSRLWWTQMPLTSSENTGAARAPGQDLGRDGVGGYPEWSP